MMIPARFLIDQAVPLDWADVLWGYRRGLIGWSAPVDLARARHNQEGVADPVQVELAAVAKDHDWKVSELLEQLAQPRLVPEGTSEKRWLYVLLLWLFEHREETDDPLGQVEDVYADFGYPDEVRPFVRYMPPEDGYDPLSHTSDENTQHMLNNWRQYLSEARTGQF